MARRRDRDGVPPASSTIGPDAGARRELSTTGRTLGQTSHRLICDTLGAELRQAMQAGPGTFNRADSIRYRASAALYQLLLDHPIDRQGRCRSCRRPGAVITLRRRPCRILIKASYWLLRQPDGEHLLSHLAADLATDGQLDPNRRDENPSR